MADRLCMGGRKTPKGNGLGVGVNMKTSSVAVFPSSMCHTIIGRSYAVPELFDTKLTLVLIRYSQQQQPLLLNWLALANDIHEEDDSLNWMQINVCSKKMRLIAPLLASSTRSKVPFPDDRARVAHVFTDLSLFNTAIGVSNCNAVHVLLVDRLGEIHWHRAGSLTNLDEAKQSLKAAATTARNRFALQQEVVLTRRNSSASGSGGFASPRSLKDLRLHRGESTGINIGNGSPLLGKALSNGQLRAQVHASKLLESQNSSSSIREVPEATEIAIRPGILEGFVKSGNDVDGNQGNGDRYEDSLSPSSPKELTEKIRSDYYVKKKKMRRKVSWDRDGSAGEYDG